MKSLLCCILAYLAGSALLDIESIWAGVAGLVVLPAIMAYPAWLVLNWIFPRGTECEQ